MIFLILSLLALSAMANPCDDTLKVAEVHVIINTAGSSWSDSDSTHKACFRFGAGTDYDCEPLNNANNDFTKNDADWYAIDRWNGLNICDMDRFMIEEGGNDALRFNRLIVLVKANNERAFVAVNDDSSKWVDGNGSTHNRNHWWTTHYTLGRSFDGSGQTVNKVIFIALTNDPSANLPTLRMTSENIDFSQQLPDNPGNDQKDDKADIWELTSGFDNMTPNRVTRVWLTPNGNDNWSWIRSAVIIETHSGYWIPVLENEQRRVDSNTAGRDEAELTPLAGWRTERRSSAHYTVGGYWEFKAAIDPHGEHNTHIERTFSSEYGTSEEQGVVDSFESTFEAATEFSLCHSVGSEGPITTNTEVCGSIGFSASATNGWEHHVFNTVHSTQSSEYTYSCSVTHTCGGPTHTTPDDMAAEMASQSKCYLYQWVTFTYNEDTETYEYLKTCSFDIIEVQAHHLAGGPRCTPDYCLDSHDCQQCAPGGPSINLPDVSINAQSDVAVGNASVEMFTAEHVKNHYWVYGAALCTFVMAGIYVKDIWTKKKSDSVYVSMVDVSMVEEI